MAQRRGRRDRNPRHRNQTERSKGQEKMVGQRSSRGARRPTHSVACAALALMLSITGAAAERLPNWITEKAQNRLVVLALDAGVGDENGALNFNGHFEGSHRIVVPVGWTVIVRMKNTDARVPHSALITKVYRQEEMPDRLGPDDAAFPGAATPVPYTGTAAGGYAEFTFAASKAGKYFVACGVHTHMQAGMWLKFDIVDGLSNVEMRHD